ncbi:hypothetical protein ACKWTF_013205 [Chironomus riparius]
MNIANIFILLCVLFIKANGLKILGVLPLASKSHWVIGHEVIQSLVDAGHEATVFTPYPLKDKIRNYEEIDISEMTKFFDFEKKMDVFKISKYPKFFSIPLIQIRGYQIAENMMQIEAVQNFVKRKEKFDVCFLEVFNLHALTGLFDHFDCTYVPYTSSTVMQWADFLTSNQSPTSYVSLPFLPYSGKMNFSQRFWNTLYALLEKTVIHVHALPKHNQIYKKYFPDAKKSMYEMISCPAFLFASSHVSVTGGQPSLPNTAEIGGVHIKKSKPLPKDLQDYLDSATDGAVVFTMGSIVKAMNFPENTREAFVRAFGRIKQKVIWKYENETLPNKPDNVMISPWIPQRDIMTHPNVKLFISHGGYLGSMEAVSEGIPILGLPMYGDQGRNMADAIEQERGLTLNVHDATEEEIFNALTEILNNPKYKKNAEDVAKRFNDRVMTPQQQIVYWTEYVARHKGAPFLRSAGCDLNAFEFHLLDVYGLMLVILLVAFYIEFKILKFIFKKLTGKSGKKQKTN